MVRVDFTQLRGRQTDGAHLPFPVARITLEICNDVKIPHGYPIYLQKPMHTCYETPAGHVYTQYLM